MARINTTKGIFKYEQRLLFFGNKKMVKATMLDNLRVFSDCLDKFGLFWGPAFGTLIGVVRNDDFQSWKPAFDICILKEDEERFKDALWNLRELGFELVRYERRGLYYLCRHGEYLKVFVLHKICSNVRHTGGSDFIHEEYLQNLIRWDFKGIELYVPQEVDKYLEFQYGADWLTPKQTVRYSSSPLVAFWTCLKQLTQDLMPDNLYYYWLLKQRQGDFRRFKARCLQAGIALPDYVQLASMKPRRYKRVLTVGVFDLIHKGHVELYRRAKGLGDCLIVAVQDSSYVLKFKPDAKLLNSTDERKYMIKSIRYVDEVVTYNTVDEIVRKVDFDVLVTGPDQTHEGFLRAIAWCEDHGKEHIVLGRTEGVSSSTLKERIKKLKG